MKYVNSLWLAVPRNNASIKIAWKSWELVWYILVATNLDIKSYFIGTRTRTWRLIQPNAHCWPEDTAIMSCGEQWAFAWKRCISSYPQWNAIMIFWVLFSLLVRISTPGNSIKEHILILILSWVIHFRFINIEHILFFFFCLIFFILRREKLLCTFSQPD